MDDEKQCMSLGFPVGQAAQVIRLGRLKFLAHFASKIRQNGPRFTRQPMAGRATQTIKQRNVEWNIHWPGNLQAGKHK